MQHTKHICILAGKPIWFVLIINNLLWILLVNYNLKELINILFFFPFRNFLRDSDEKWLINHTCWECLDSYMLYTLDSNKSLQTMPQMSIGKMHYVITVSCKLSWVRSKIITWPFLQPKAAAFLPNAFLEMSAVSAGSQSKGTGLLLIIVPWMK